MNHLSRRQFVTLSASAALARWPLRNARAIDTDLRTHSYRNPILPGDHPDTSCIHVGNDYYIVNSSFFYTPGLLIWHSNNLVDWTPVAAALDQYYGNVWAPYLCEDQGRFYIYFPVDSRIFVVHADAPTGPWSKPIDLKLRGIDPCHLRLADGRRVLFIAGGDVVDLAPDGLSTTSKPRHAYSAWPIPDSWQVECECLEGPKAFIKDGYIYLTVAEGGTAGPPTSHMVISMRSRSPDGPWEMSPHNPILHTANRNDYWWSVGHGRLVQSVEGPWWMTCHAYENGYYNLGRQTLLVPVEWTPDGWYRVKADITKNAPLPLPSRTPSAPFPDLSDDFSASQLKLPWQFFKGYDPSRVTLADHALVLKADGTAPENSSPLTVAAGDRSYTVEVDVEAEPGCAAGLVLFYSGEHYVGFRLQDGNLTYPRNSSTRNLGRHGNRLTLRLVNDQQILSAYFQSEGKWNHVQLAVDVEPFNQNILRDFLALRPSLYACGQGHATFRNFRYLKGAHPPEIQTGG